MRLIIKTLQRTVLIFVICISPIFAHGKDTISWLEAVAPPFFIHKGEFAGQGYEDVITDILVENLPEYSHERIIANISRHYKEFKDGRKACNIGLYKTPEREEFLYYSIPSFFTLPAVLIINKSKYASFGSRKTVTLQEVLQKDLIVGRSTKRSYGKQVDDILNQYGNDKNIFLYEGSELSLNFFEMLKLDRLDGLIGLPEEAMYQAERLGIRDQIMTLTITENQTSYDGWFSYVACSKNDWGKELITKVNNVLLQQRATDRYRQAYERWLDESSLEGYRKLYNDVFVKVID